MNDLGGSPEDGGGTVTFTGEDPIVPSHFRIGSSMAIPAMAAAVGAAAIYKDRTGESQDLSVDLRESVMNVNPLLTLIMQERMLRGAIPKDDPVANGFSFVPTVNNRWYQAPLGVGNPFSFAIYELKDGKYCTITGVYPHLEERALRMLGVPPVREKIAAALKQITSEELEKLMDEYRVVGGVHRTTEEWLAHPQGKYLAETPLIDIVKVGDSAPVPFKEDNPEQPLSGLKVLSLTHVIAGTCAARTLAEYGAEVLQVARDQSFEHEGLVTDVNVGMRSIFLNLNKESDRRSLRELVKDADVFIESFRGRSIANFGFGAEELAKMNPGIVTLSVRAYGWEGPWWDRAGFDMEALTVTGYTIAEGSGGRPSFGDTYGMPAPVKPSVPQFPPTMVLNDYIAGYLGAAGVIAALRKRAREGGSYHVRISLARAAMWYASLGMFPNKDVDTSAEEHKMIPMRTLEADSGYGKVHRLAPQVKLSKTPGKWRSPLVTVRGSSEVEWEQP